MANSNPGIVRVGAYWITKLARNKVDYSVQIHIDNDEAEIKAFWAEVLTIPSETIKTIRKSNSGQLSGRQWRSMHGVLMVRSSDTYFRSRLQAWMDKIQEEWYTQFS